jgi:hypothetical protein
MVWLCVVLIVDAELFLASFWSGVELCLQDGKELIASCKKTSESEDHKY